jgi:hypothetical protein
MWYFVPWAIPPPPPPIGKLYFYPFCDSLIFTPQLLNFSLLKFLFNLSTSTFRVTFLFFFSFIVCISHYFLSLLPLVMFPPRDIADVAPPPASWGGHICRELYTVYLNHCFTNFYGSCLVVFWTYSAWLSDFAWTRRRSPPAFGASMWPAGPGRSSPSIPTTPRSPAKPYSQFNSNKLQYQTH